MKRTRKACSDHGKVTDVVYRQMEPEYQSSGIEDGRRKGNVFIDLFITRTTERKGATVSAVGLICNIRRESDIPVTCLRVRTVMRLNKNDRDS